MASKKQQQLMEIQIQKVLNRRPEIIEQQRNAVIISHMASALTIVLDYMVRRYDWKTDDCEEMMDYFLQQLAEIGKDEWLTFFTDVDKLIIEDIGFSPAQYIGEHLRYVGDDE